MPTMRLTLLLLLTALLGACGGKLAPLGQTGAVRAVDARELLAPNGGAATTAGTEYRFGPFDKITVDVVSLPEASREVQADSAGRIALPIIGTVAANGRSPAELTAIIVDKLRAGHVRNPQVSVNLKETLSQLVTIDGQVKAPGVYPVMGGMTLMRAVATARGLDEFARLDDVVVFRNVAGEQMAALYNLGAIRRGNYGDPPIYGNDIIIVGDSKSRRLFKDLLQIVPLLTSPIIVAFQKL